ncbi:MAG: 4Fe-4S binding protein [Bacillota bacterium]|nr:4Fe-4S binding protein [Bacillota bacterium]
MNTVVRKIISIDESKCDGCGLCIPSCEEGALQIVDGKARLVKDIYCDGLGNCLGECPQGAIDIIEREAEPFDEEAVEEHLKNLKGELLEEEECSVCCGSSVARDISHERISIDKKTEENGYIPEAELSHWPVQIHLVNPDSHFMKDVDLLIAADCVPFAYADFHRKFLAGRSLLVGCPKLDDVNAYHQKLASIFKNNKLKSVTLAHMEVGCCFGMSQLVKSAMKTAGVEIPLNEVIIGVDGEIKTK